MIKANELMIGNWVFHNNKPIKVAGIVENRIASLDNEIGVRLVFSIKVDEIEPIPITEELLEKCSFKECRRIGGFVAYSDLSALSGNHLFFDKGEYRLCGVERNITYLHELQNVYFMLTKKQLDIKL